MLIDQISVPGGSIITTKGIEARKIKIPLKQVFASQETSVKFLRWEGDVAKPTANVLEVSMNDQCSSHPLM